MTTAKQLEQRCARAAGVAYGQLTRPLHGAAHLLEIRHAPGAGVQVLLEAHVVLAAERAMHVVGDELGHLLAGQPDEAWDFHGAFACARWCRSKAARRRERAWCRRTRCSSSVRPSALCTSWLVNCSTSRSTRTLR